jgi:hypothetical protein
MFNFRTKQRKLLALIRELADLVIKFSEHALTKILLVCFELLPDLKDFSFVLVFNGSELEAAPLLCGL